jgi:hypothetical protein
LRKVEKTQVTIGKFATMCLEKGKSAQETLELVKRVYPTCNTSIKCIYYYASKAKIKLAKGSECDQDEMSRVLEELG